MSVNLSSLWVFRKVVVKCLGAERVQLSVPGTGTHKTPMYTIIYTLHNITMTFIYLFYVVVDDDGIDYNHICRCVMQLM